MNTVELNELTKEAMKTRNTHLKNVVDDIKTKFKYWLVEHPEKKGTDSDAYANMSEDEQMAIFKKLADMRKQTIEQSAGREDIIADASAELAILKQWLPEEVSKEQIETAVKNMIADGIAPEKKNKGVFMKTLKANFKNADGKMVSAVVDSFLC